MTGNLWRSLAVFRHGRADHFPEQQLVQKTCAITHGIFAPVFGTDSQIPRHMRGCQVFLALRNGG